MPVRGGVGGAWTLIAETILGAPAATVTFAAIPGTYRHLAMLVQARGDAAAEGFAIYWQANGDTGAAQYAYYFSAHRRVNTVFDGVNRNTNMAMLSYRACEGANSRASCFGGFVGWWHGYARVDREKSSLTPTSKVIGNMDNDNDLYLDHTQGHWKSTAAITSLTLIPTGGNFVAPSIFALYGIN